jgi:alanyl-tRNA synthetase
MTEKLYHADQYQHAFTSSVLERLEIDGTPALRLAQTAFYPTSGGQPHDTGTLNGVRVIDVRETDEHRILHLLEQPVADDIVEGRVDWACRFDHMQQHTGQHLLSQACITLCQAETISFHLGDDSSTIDVTLPDMSSSQITDIELLANRCIYENRPVRIHWATQDDLTKFPVRKLPTVAENIRIVEISDFDFSPCGGTHCAYTGEIGIIKISKWENYKGGTRLHFLCGSRALRDYQQKTSLLKQLSEQLTAGERDLPQLVDKLYEENKSLRKDVSHVSEQLLRYEAATLVAECEKQGEVCVLSKLFENRSQNDLKALAAAVLEQTSQTIVLFGSRLEGKAALVFSRTKDLSVNMNELMKAACAVIGGRGGGPPHQAQGGGPDVENLAEALQAATALIGSTPGKV